MVGTGVVIINLELFKKRQMFYPEKFAVEMPFGSLQSLIDFLPVRNNKFFKDRRREHAGKIIRESFRPGLHRLSKVFADSPGVI